MNAVVENGIDRPSLIVQHEEVEDLLDELDIYMFSMQAEMHRAGECADELANMCYEVDRCNEPIALDPARPNERFRELLALIGADAPESLSAASGADVRTCAAVLENPIGCDACLRVSVVSGLETRSADVIWSKPSGKDAYSVGDMLYLWMRENFRTCDACLRVSVVSGLETRSADVIWSKPSGKDAYSVGDMLYLWMRENFRTPFIYVQDVYAGRVKTKLVGAVDSLTPNELLSLDKRDAVTALKKMASGAA